MPVPRILDRHGNEMLPASQYQHMEKIASAFHGASFTDTDLATWNTSLNSPDADVIPEKHTLDARALDAVRNDGYISGGRDIHLDSIVGDHFRLVAKPNYEYLQTLDKRFDESWADEFKEASEARFKNYAENEEYWVDATRKQNFSEMVRTQYASYFDSGECLATGEWIRSDSPNSTAIKNINTARLSSPDGKQDGRYLRGGVRLNRRGVPLGYHIRESLPDSLRLYGNSRPWKWRYIPRKKRWGRTQVIHIFNGDRAEQNRAVSRLVSVLETIRSCKRFRKIQLQRAVLNAMYAATLESDLPGEAAYQTIGVESLSNGEKVTEEVPYLNYYMAESANYQKGAGFIKMDGVRVPTLPPGTKFKLNAANGVDAVGSDFEQSMLRYLASALGLSYEQFARDFTQTNYSSARFASLDTWKGFMVKRRLVPGKYASQVYSLWLEEEMDLLRLPMPNSNIHFWDAKSAFCESEWIGGGRGQIDEVKETQAAALRVAFNFSTHEHETARLSGKDYRDVFKQRAKEEKMIRDLELQSPDATVKGVNNQKASEGGEEDKPGNKSDDAEAFSQMPLVSGLSGAAV